MRMPRRSDRRRARHLRLWRVVNPPARVLAGTMPWWVLLETKGRRTGLARLTPLARGPVDGQTLWLISVHGSKASWVRNIEATPAVRIKMSGRWHRARAAVRPFDEELVRRFGRYPRAGPKVLGMDPRLVEVELGEVEGSRPRAPEGG